jgi:hypothetical protein
MFRAPPYERLDIVRLDAATSGLGFTHLPRLYWPILLPMKVSFPPPYALTERHDMVR